MRDPADYMHVCLFTSANALLLARGGTLLPAHFGRLARGQFRLSAEFAAAVAQRLNPPILREPFSRFAPADVALLLRWIYKLPSEPGEPDEPPSAATARRRRGSRRWPPFSSTSAWPRAGGTRRARPRRAAARDQSRVLGGGARFSRIRQMRACGPLCISTTF